MLGYGAGAQVVWRRRNCLPCSALSTVQTWRLSQSVPQFRHTCCIACIFLMATRRCCAVVQRLYPSQREKCAGYLWQMICSMCESRDLPMASSAYWNSQMLVDGMHANATHRYVWPFMPLGSSTVQCVFILDLTARTIVRSCIMLFSHRCCFDRVLCSNVPFSHRNSTTFFIDGFLTADIGFCIFEVIRPSAVTFGSCKQELIVFL